MAGMSDSKLGLFLCIALLLSTIIHPHIITPSSFSVISLPYHTSLTSLFLPYNLYL